jgi:hypothetical protein
VVAGGRVWMGGHKMVRSTVSGFGERIERICRWISSVQPVPKIR